MEPTLELTETESVAKEYLKRIVIEASAKPCDVGHGSDINATLPVWYDDQKYKRGQQYFQDNRMGILGSNLCGLLTLLAEPKGLKLLSSTGRSSTPETARKRYVSTILHVLRWYEIDLSPGSGSWDSLNRVRRLHLNASNAASAKNIGLITQAEIALTTLGFMGFALTRPHLLGIQHNCREDQEAFVHFWAVMGHMLGVSDQYNMCLLPLDSVTVVCQAMIRYIFMPLIQLETPEFRRMVDALFSGMSQFMPHMTYDIQMFTVKRILGVPGYQFDVDLDKEIVCRQLFTTDEVTEMRKAIVLNTGYAYPEVAFNQGIPIIRIHRGSAAVKNSSPGVDDMNGRNSDGSSGEGGTSDEKYSPLIEENDKLTPLMELLELDSPKQLQIDFVDGESGWRSHMNDSAFYQLSNRDQRVVRARIRIIRATEYRVIRYFVEKALGVVLYMMRKWYSSKPSARITSSG